MEGKKAVEAGFQLSEYWIPGLGGRERSKDHALNTARVLTEINPHYIRTRPFKVMPGTPLGQAYDKGDFNILTLQEQLIEMKLMIEELNVTSKFCFDHASNSWKNRRGGLLFSQDYEGYKFPDDKFAILKMIEEGIDNN